MTFVLDASITLSWCFSDQATPLSDAALARLTEDEALVPELWPFEVANVLAVAERRGRLRSAQTLQFVQLLGQLPITVEELGRGAILSTVVDLARTTGLTAYDASYLALAASAGLPLATDDSLLRQAALAAGVELLGLTGAA